MLLSLLLSCCLLSDPFFVSLKASAPGASINNLTQAGSVHLFAKQFNDMTLEEKWVMTHSLVSPEPQVCERGEEEGEGRKRGEGEGEKRRREREGEDGIPSVHVFFFVAGRWQLWLGLRCKVSYCRYQLLSLPSLSLYHCHGQSLNSHPHSQLLPQC